MFAISLYSFSLFTSALAAATVDLETLQAGIFLRLDAMQLAVEQDDRHGVKSAMDAIAALLPRDLDFEAGNQADFLKRLGDWIGALRQFAAHYVGGIFDLETAREDFRILREAFPELAVGDVDVEVEEAEFAQAATKLRELTAGGGGVATEVTVGEPGMVVWDLSTAEVGEEDLETAAQHLSGRVYRHLKEEPAGSILIIDLALPRGLFEGLAFSLWRHLRAGDLRPFTGKSLIVRARYLGREARIEVDVSGKPYLNIIWGSIG